MTHLTASNKRSSAAVWIQRAKDVSIWLAIAAVAFLIGAYGFAPGQQKAQPSYLPDAYLKLATGNVSLIQEGGSGVILPVRIADTSSTRMIGFRDVGEDALVNQFLLYAQTRQSSTRISYSTENVRVPLDLAAFDNEGNLVSISSSTAGDARMTVTEPHRWLLAAKAGTFAHYGVVPGVRLDPESIQKLNL